MNPDQKYPPSNYQPQQPQTAGPQPTPQPGPQFGPQSRPGQFQPVQPQQPMNDPYANVIYGDAGAPKKSKRKKILLLCGLVLLLAIGSTGFVFGYYLPNKPENVWKTSLNRTGEALQKTVASATEKDKLASFTKSQLSADANFKSKDYTISGTLKSTYDEHKQNGSIDVTSKQTDQAEKVFGAKFLSELKEGSLYPSVYFQLNGLKTLGLEGLEAYFPGLTSYDGKWIAVEEGYLRGIADQVRKAELAEPDTTPKPTATEPKKEETVTSEDIAELARTVSTTMSEYVLTTTPEKAVFEQRKFIGKETVEGLKTYRYQVGINKAHAKDFCKVITERILATKLSKKAMGDDVTQEAADKEKASRIKECQDSVENDIKQDETFDLWVDTKYKLIHKIRAYSDDKKTYVDFGQTYKGGDDLLLFVVLHEEDDASADDKFVLDTNLKTSETKATLTAKSAKPDEAFDLSMIFTAKPFTEEIKVDKPAGSVPIKDIFDRYGFDPAALVSLIGGSTTEPEYSEEDLLPASQPIIYQN